MRNIYLITAALASMILASCANEEIVGNEAGTGTTTNGVISFGGLAPAMTRAELYGNAAATKLNNKFVVYGTKHKTAEDNTVDNDEVVFNNFQVAYTASTAGTTASNTSDWDYVGLPAYDAAITSQGIKYWDYSAAQGHTFYAFSSPDISYPMDATNDKVQVVKTKSDVSSLYNKGYEVTIKDASKLSNLYFSDRVEVPKEKYDKTVDLTFRNIGTKVRFGFYETIPGYTVKIDKFYIDDANTAVVTDFATMNDAQTDGFYASLQNVKTSADQTINVTYYDAGEIINQPKVSNPTGGFDYNIKLGDASTIINKELATTSSAPTWVNGTTDNGYATVFPFEGNTNPLLVKLDFTMTADDGSADVINVKGARAIIPAKYVQWKGNFAYTYILKISDKTNGTTGKTDENGDPDDDPEGLKPITFDAIVVDITDERQETITSVSTNSITTYAEGEIVNEYTNGKPIYVVTTNNSTHNVITPSAIGIGAGQARVYKIDKATTEASVLAKLTGSPIDITLDPLSPLPTIETTVPLADGTTAAIANVKFTPSVAGYYAYVYTTKAYVAPTYAVQNSGTYDSSKTYYMLSESGAYFAVTVRNEAAFNANKSSLYLQTAAGTPGEYDIKVIKVQ